MSTASDGVDLDFTGILSATALQTALPPLPKKLPEELVIGAKAVKKGGFFVNIVNPPKATGPRKRAPNVLIVEDDPSTLLLLEHVLNRAEFKTQRAIDGATFIAAIRVPPVPDLVLLDLELPDVSGLRILTKLREHPQTKALPVLILSARSEPKDVYQCLSLGANGYVTKPTKAGVLLQAVRSVLGA